MDQKGVGDEPQQEGEEGRCLHGPSDREGVEMSLPEKECAPGHKEKETRKRVTKGNRGAALVRGHAVD